MGNPRILTKATLRYNRKPPLYRIMLIQSPMSYNQATHWRNGQTMVFNFHRLYSLKRSIPDVTFQYDMTIPSKESCTWRCEPTQKFPKGTLERWHEQGHPKGGQSSQAGLIWGGKGGKGGGESEIKGQEMRRGRLLKRVWIVACWGRNQ